jgi:hypothetical protein
LRTLADYRVLHAPLRSDSYSKNWTDIGELAGLNGMDSSRQRYLKFSFFVAEAKGEWFCL